MDTPRSNAGDATFLGRQPPDFDMTLEPSFHAPAKDNDLLQQMRTGRAVNLRTPRGSRAPFGDRRNIPAGLGGSEFTPMLKSATRNSTRKRGKENTNGLATPALAKVDEDMDMTNVPVESSLFGPSRNMSYVDATPLPAADASSNASTPLVLPTRRGGNKGLLQDGNQLSLREQENVIDKIEKENFGLKLKIHFLEEALRKTGPGFGEAALKENTDLKVDKVTMQRELSKYKKQLVSAEKDLETYQQQILDIQERAKKKYADQTQKAENEALNQRLEEKEARIESLERQLQERHTDDDDKLGELQDKISDLEADLRAKDREINDREDELDELKMASEGVEEKWKVAEAEIKQLQRQLQRQSQSDDQASQLHRNISELETNLREKDQAINDREADIEDLRQQLEDRSQNANYVNQLHAKISGFEASLRAKDEETREHQVRIKEMKERFEASLRAKDEETREHHVRIKEMKERWETAEAKIEVLQQQRRSQDDSQINQLRDEISQLEASLRAKDQEAEDREDLIDELNLKVKEVEAAVREKENEAEEREDEIDELNRKLEKLNASVQATVRERDDKIDELNRKLEKLNASVQAEVREREETIDDLESKLEAAERGRKTAEKRVAEIEERGRSREEQAKDMITSLESNIHRLQQQLNEKNDRLQQAIDAEGSLSGKEQVLRDTLNGELERHKKEEAALHLQIESLKRDLEARQAALTSLRGTLDNETQRHNDEEIILRRQLDGLRRDLAVQESNAADSEVERHKKEEGALRVQIDGLQRNIEAQNSKLSALQREVSSLQDELLQRELDGKEQAETIEALEDEVEVLQATLDEESEDATKKLREADELCQDLRRQLEQARRSQVSRVDHLDQLQEADRVAENLRQQLRQREKEMQERLEAADKLSRDLRRQLEQARRSQVSRAEHLDQLDEADRVAESLRQQLHQREKEMQERLRRIRQERDEYRASVAKLEVDCERLKKGAQDALAWIQARNAEQANSISSGPTKAAHIRYGEIEMDMVDQKDHEAVIRAADSAQRRHEKELRGMQLQMEYIEALLKRESKLRHDGAFAKKYLQLRLDIADAW